VDDVLGYKGKRVVVTGAASGMGEQVARIAYELDAHVIGADVKPVSTTVTESIQLDLTDEASISATVDAIDGPVDALFSCAGLPGAPFSDLDVGLVNFIGARALIEGLVPKMPEGSAIACIASSAGIGWQQELAAYQPLLDTTSFAEAKAWCEQNPEQAFPIGGYRMSKVVLNQYVALASVDLAERGIRINCLNPGPTNSPMMPAFHAIAGKDIVDAALGPIARYCEPVEQAWPMICLNSPRFSYVTGEALWADGGFLAAMTVGRKAGFEGL
jgi:NAD(P)-dependent dehydrogenase (short-subunit alcohol dehydrogenase family)